MRQWIDLMEGVDANSIDQNEIAQVAAILEEVLNQNNEYDSLWPVAEQIVEQIAVDRHYRQVPSREKIDFQLEVDRYRFDGENTPDEKREEVLDRLCAFYNI